jgi:hypothetical protein
MSIMTLVDRRETVVVLETGREGTPNDPGAVGVAETLDDVERVLAADGRGR